MVLAEYEVQDTSPLVPFEGPELPSPDAEERRRLRDRAQSEVPRPLLMKDTLRAQSGDALIVEIGKGRAVSNNNPGNLEFHHQRGAIGSDGRFAQFRTPEEGLEALARDLQAKQTGQSNTGVTADTTLAHFASVWLGGKFNPENDFQAYVDGLVYLLRDFGAKPSTPIGQIPNWALTDAVAYLESNTRVSRETLER